MIPESASHLADKTIRSRKYVFRADATETLRKTRDVQLKGAKMLRNNNIPMALNIAVISLS